MVATEAHDSARVKRIIANDESITFKRTVTTCLDAQIATAEVVHIDASLIRADVSWESLVKRHVSDVVTENRNEEEIEAEKRGRQSGKYKKVSRTDADASMATTARNRRLEPCYKQHTAVGDVRGVVLDVAVTTGEVNEVRAIQWKLRLMRFRRSRIARSRRSRPMPAMPTARSMAGLNAAASIR